MQINLPVLTLNILYGIQILKLSIIWKQKFIENNWIKKSTSATIDAHKLRKRYIKTGIANFTSGRYPNGCLLGYVVEGNTHKIVELLNKILIAEKRTKEILVNSSKIHGIDSSFISMHEGTSRSLLNHFMLDLS